MLPRVDCEHFHARHITDPIAHQVTGVLRASELLVVQAVVVYISNKMFSWHLLCLLSLEPSATLYPAQWLTGQLLGDD